MHDRTATEQSTAGPREKIAQPGAAKIVNHNSLACRRCHALQHADNLRCFQMMQEQTVHDHVVPRQWKGILQYIALMKTQSVNSGCGGLLCGSCNGRGTDINTVDQKSAVELLQSTCQPERHVTTAAGQIKNCQRLPCGIRFQQIPDPCPDSCSRATPAIDSSEPRQCLIVQGFLELRIVHQLGLPTTMTAFAFIGVAVTSATIVVFGEAIWDPVALIARIGSPAVIIFGAIVVLVAQLTTNMAANVDQLQNSRTTQSARLVNTASISSGVIFWA